MDAIKIPEIPKDIQQELDTVLGQTCCRQFVGSDLSLFIGFGGIIFVKNIRETSYPHGKWEIGTYRRAWRMIENQRIVCGSECHFDTLEELRQKIGRLEGAKCTSIRMLTDFDVRIEFDHSFCIDIFALFGDDDDVLRMFLPSGRSLGLSIRGEWSAEDDNSPPHLRN
jgi:hypothetical protein